MSYYDSDPPAPCAPPFCEVCGKDECDCLECPVCAVTGRPDCYTACGMLPAHDSVASFCEHVGMDQRLPCALRAIDKHSTHTLSLVLADGSVVGLEEGRDLIKGLEERPYTRISLVRVAGIAWNVGETCAAGNGWEALNDLRDNYEDAHAEWREELKP